MRKWFGLSVYMMLTVCACLFTLPIILVFCGSFMSQTELKSIYEKADAFVRLIPSPVSTESYYRLLFSNDAYLAAFWNSVLIAVYTVAGQCAVSLVVGFALWQKSIPGSKLMKAVYAFVMLLPFQVTMLPNYMQIRQIGLYNSPWALVLPGMFAPLGVFLMIQFMQGLSNEIIEASLLDTSSPVQVLVYIVGPNVLPAVWALALITFAESWNMVEQPLIMLKDAWRYPLSLRLNQQGEDLAITFAGAVLFMTPVYFLYQMFKDSLLAGIERVGLKT